MNQSHFGPATNIDSSITDAKLEELTDRSEVKELIPAACNDQNEQCISNHKFENNKHEDGFKCQFDKTD